MLEYGTFLGGNSNEIASRGGLAADGNIVYVASATRSTNFAGCSGEVTNGIFVVKLDATPDSDPNDLLWCAGFPRGASAQGLALDVTGVYVIGTTRFADFITTDGSSTPDGVPSIFVAKCSTSDGSVLYSTIIGEVSRVQGTTNMTVQGGKVCQAQQEKEKLINEARRDYNKVIPLAEGEKDQRIREADGYRLKRINEAEGDVARFSALFAEYSKAPEVTRRRIYIETMQDVMPNIRAKVIVDDDAQSILPLLNLNTQ